MQIGTLPKRGLVTSNLQFCTELPSDSLIAYKINSENNFGGSANLLEAQNPETIKIGEKVGQK